MPQFLPAAKRAAQFEVSAGLQSCIHNRLVCCSWRTSPLSPLHHPFIPSCICVTSIPCAPWGMSIVSSVLHPWAMQDCRYSSTANLCCCSSLTVLLRLFAKGQSKQAAEGRKREKCSKIAIKSFLFKSKQQCTGQMSLSLIFCNVFCTCL